MRIVLSILLVTIHSVESFIRVPGRVVIISPTSLYGTNRRARRLQQKQSSKEKQKLTTKTTSNELEDLIAKEADGFKKKASGNEELKDEIPDISTVVVDEETGIERIKQGKAVMDVITRKAVKLFDNPLLRLAQFSPGVPPEIREKYRFKNFYTNLEVPDIVSAFMDSAYINGKLPEHPSVSDEALDFVLANRDYLGFHFKKTLGRLKLRSQSLKQTDEAMEYRALWKHFLTIEDHLSAPFRQLILDAESVIGPNFGNLNVTTYLDGELVERCAYYVTLKATVAHWEKKVRDAESFESTTTLDLQKRQNLSPQQRWDQAQQQMVTTSQDSFIQTLSVGDPKRYLPEPPIIFRLEDSVRVCSMAQKIAVEFVKQDKLFADLPPELRFLEKALYIKGGTALRRYMVEEFCPSEGITSQALRVGLRRFDTQLANLQIDPYGDFKNVVSRLIESLAVGTEEERDLYIPYLANLDEQGPGYFQTYTFNHPKNSLVRFLDTAKKIEKGSAGPADEIAKQLSNEFSSILGFSSQSTTSGSSQRRIDPMRPDYEPEESYKPPAKRAAGRPHNVGWLNILPKENLNPEQQEKLESDLWKEIEN